MKKDMVLTKLSSRLLGKLKRNKICVKTVCQCLSKDGNRVLTINAEYPSPPDDWAPTYGINITSAKKKCKSKYTSFDFLLMSVKDMESLKSTLENYKSIIKPVFYQCICTSEILRVEYYPDDKEIVIDIFDNYFCKYKKHKFFSEIIISENDIKEFTEKLLI